MINYTPVTGQKLKSIHTLPEVDPPLKSENTLLFKILYKLYGTVHEKMMYLLYLERSTRFDPRGFMFTT